MSRSQSVQRTRSRRDVGYTEDDTSTGSFRRKLRDPRATAEQVRLRFQDDVRLLSAAELRSLSLDAVSKMLAKREKRWRSSRLQKYTEDDLKTSLEEDLVISLSGNLYVNARSLLDSSKGNLTAQLAAMRDAYVKQFRRKHAQLRQLQRRLQSAKRSKAQKMERKQWYTDNQTAVGSAGVAIAEVANTLTKGLGNDVTAQNAVLKYTEHHLKTSMHTFEQNLNDVELFASDRDGGNRTGIAAYLSRLVTDRQKYIRLGKTLTETIIGQYLADCLPLASWVMSTFKVGLFQALANGWLEVLMEPDYESLGGAERAGVFAGRIAVQATEIGTRYLVQAGLVATGVTPFVALPLAAMLAVTGSNSVRMVLDTFHSGLGSTEALQESKRPVSRTREEQARLMEKSANRLVAFAWARNGLAAGVALMHPVLAWQCAKASLVSTLGQALARPVLIRLDAALRTMDATVADLPESAQRVVRMFLFSSIYAYVRGFSASVNEIGTVVAMAAVAENRLTQAAAERKLSSPELSYRYAFDAVEKVSARAWQGFTRMPPSALAMAVADGVVQAATQRSAGAVIDTATTVGSTVIDAGVRTASALGSATSATINRLSSAAGVTVGTMSSVASATVGKVSSTASATVDTMGSVLSGAQARVEEVTSAAVNLDWSAKLTQAVQSLRTASYLQGEFGELPAAAQAEVAESKRTIRQSARELQSLFCNGTPLAQELAQELARDWEEVTVPAAQMVVDEKLLPPSAGNPFNPNSLGNRVVRPDQCEDPYQAQRDTDARVAQELLLASFASAPAGTQTAADAPTYGPFSSPRGQSIRVMEAKAPPTAITMRTANTLLPLPEQSTTPAQMYSADLSRSFRQHPAWVALLQKYPELKEEQTLRSVISYMSEVGGTVVDVATGAPRLASLVPGATGVLSAVRLGRTADTALSGAALLDDIKSTALTMARELREDLVQQGYQPPVYAAASETWSQTVAERTVSGAATVGRYWGYLRDSVAGWFGSSSALQAVAGAASTAEEVLSMGPGQATDRLLQTVIRDTGLTPRQAVLGLAGLDAERSVEEVRNSLLAGQTLAGV